MTTESLEELRERLLHQPGVQEMIQVRAYEIFQMRGGQPGGEAQDWFHAEGDVLAFLIARESAREDENAEVEPADAAPASDARPAAPLTRKPRPRAAAKPAIAKPAAPKKTASKRSTTKKPQVSKSKSKRPSNQSKTEESNQ